MLDSDHVEALMALRGISDAAALARLAGVERQTVRRMLTGDIKAENSQWKTITSIARALGVQVDDLCVENQFQRTWKKFSWLDRENMDRYYSEINNVDSCLICTRGMDIYLQPDDLLHWSFSQAHRAIGWAQAQIDRTLAAGKRQAHEGDLEHRLASHSLHRLICRAGFFERAFDRCSDWLDGLRANLRELNGNTIIGLVPETRWATFDRTVHAAVQQCIGVCPRWDKVTVADRTFAMIRPNLDEFQVTYHRPTVDFLRGVLVRAAGENVGYEFPLRTFALREIRGGLERSIRELESIARSKQRKRKSHSQQRVDTGFWAPLALGPQYQLVGDLTVDGAVGAETDERKPT